ncbi:hypothetical protein GCM10020360_32580 [Nonlabens tegetincola]
MTLNEVSTLLFGRACRLPIALWVLEHGDGKFYQSEPPTNLGSQTAIRQELSRLAKAGLIAEERTSNENRVYYRRINSPLWRIFAEAEKATNHDQ